MFASWEALYQEAWKEPISKEDAKVHLRLDVFVRLNTDSDRDSVAYPTTMQPGAAVEYDTESMSLVRNPVGTKCCRCHYQLSQP
jgi:hypothetical protein